MKHSKIYNLSRVLRFSTVIAMVVLVGLALLFAVFIPLGIYLTPTDELSTISSPSLFLTFFMYALSTACLIYALEQLRRLFTSYMSGEVISNHTAGLIRKSGLGLLWSAIVEISVFPVSALITAATNLPADFGNLDTFGLSQVGFLFAAGILIVIGWAMSEAAQIAEENRAFV